MYMLFCSFNKLFLIGCVGIKYTSASDIRGGGYLATDLTRRHDLTDLYHCSCRSHRNGRHNLLSIRVDLAADILPTTGITLLYNTGSGRFECRLTSILVAVPAVVVLSPYDL